MLHHLKKWLAQISIARPPPAKPTLIMELVPAIKEGIEKQVNCALHLKITPYQTYRIKSMSNTTFHKSTYYIALYHCNEVRGEMGGDRGQAGGDLPGAGGRADAAPGEL